MKKRITILASLLAFQIATPLPVLAAESTEPANSVEVEVVQKSLLPFKIEQVTKLVITKGDDHVVIEKTKEGDSWKLPEQHDLPVMPGKLNKLLGLLDGLETNEPLTSLAKDHQSLRVAADNYWKKISLYEGDKTLGEVFIGPTPVRRKSVMRLAGTNEVYNLKFFAYPISVDETDWLDKNVLAGIDGVTQIKGSDYQLSQKADKSWFFANNKDATPNLERVNLVLGAIKKLRVMEVVPEEDLIAIKEGGEKTFLEVNNGKLYRFDFITYKKRHYVKRSDSNLTYRLQKPEFNQLTKPDLEWLSLITEEPAAKSEAAESSKAK